MKPTRCSQHHRRPGLRPLPRIERAHDLLAGILNGDVPLELAPEDERQAHTALDVLCWVLEHQHNPTFANNLHQLEEKARKRGFLE